MKTSELTGDALNWAVAKVEYDWRRASGEPIKRWVIDDHAKGILHGAAYANDWAWGGPIIEREGIGLSFFPVGVGAPFWIGTPHEQRPEGSVWASGDTPLIAAMRCYVASKLGDEVDIPQELL